MHTIKTIRLTKNIKGNLVLDDINLFFQSSIVYGLIGENGSGKTMLFRILSGLVKPSSGCIMMDDGVAYEKGSPLKKIGVVIENASLYPEFTGFKNLMYLAGINHVIGKTEVIDTIRRVGLDPDDKRTIRKYSLGMKQRIAIAQAIMEKPDFLFLDEPTNALDHNGVALIRKVIKEEAARGALVIIASHSSEDIDELCQKKYYISDGKITDSEGVI